MYITRVKLENIRGFRKLELTLLGDKKHPRMRTAIVGKNVTCKTTGEVKPIR